MRYYEATMRVQGQLMPDCAHMLVSIPPKLSVSQHADTLKGKSPLMIFENKAAIKKYIQE